MSHWVRVLKSGYYLLVYIYVISSDNATCYDSLRWRLGVSIGNKGYRYHSLVGLIDSQNPVCVYFLDWSDSVIRFCDSVIR